MNTSPSQTRPSKEHGREQAANVTNTDLNTPHLPENSSIALKILGLNHSEKKILESTSKLALPISTIARMTGIPRTSILYILKKLQKRALVKKIATDGNIPFWKSDLSKVIAQIGMNREKGGSVFSIYRGAKQIFAIFEEFAALPKNSRVIGIQPNRSLLNALRKNKLKDLLRINEQIKDKGLIFEGVVHERSVDAIIAEMGKDAARKVFDSFIGRLEDYAKIPDEFADVCSEIYIFKGTAYLINWDREIAIGIHDKDMTDLLIAMFSCVKEVGTRYSQNAKMKLYKEALKDKLDHSPK